MENNILEKENEEFLEYSFFGIGIFKFIYLFIYEEFLEYSFLELESSNLFIYLFI
jgi:hypothetical protein